jgi:hypothetical protein
MIAGHLARGKKLGKYAEGLIDPTKIASRHRDLVRELGRRFPLNGKHKTPLEEVNTCERGFVFDETHNLRELASRCERCCRRQGKMK